MAHYWGGKEGMDLRIPKKIELIYTCKEPKRKRSQGALPHQMLSKVGGTPRFSSMS